MKFIIVVNRGAVRGGGGGVRMILRARQWGGGGGGVQGLFIRHIINYTGYNQK